MINVTSTYQRTDAGREEIRRKSHGLTQSERLVLILIDGITDVAGVRAKLRGLTDDRYQRAMQKLIRNKLITEILLPLVDQKPEEVDDDIAELFLRQDALDPVTIISMDPEDEYDSQASIAPSSDDKSAKPQASQVENTAGGNSGNQWAHLRTSDAPEARDEPATLSAIARNADDANSQYQTTSVDESIRQSAQPARASHGSGNGNSSYSQHNDARRQPGGFKWQYWLLLAIASVAMGLGILFY